MLYPQNGNGVVAVDVVTSLRPMYRRVVDSFHQKDIVLGGCVLRRITACE